MLSGSRERYQKHTSRCGWPTMIASQRDKGLRFGECMSQSHVLSAPEISKQEIISCCHAIMFGGVERGVHQMPTSFCLFFQKLVGATILDPDCKGKRHEAVAKNSHTSTSGHLCSLETEKQFGSQPNIHLYGISFLW